MSPLSLLLPLAIAPARAQTPAQAEIGADLRGEYLAGQPIPVRFTAHNDGDDTRAFADLTARPWLVTFRLEGGGAPPRELSAPAPDSDPGRRWTLGPRAQRQALLAIPDSEGLPPGDYTLTVTLDDDAGAVTLPAHSFSLARPRPVAGALTYDPLGLDHVGYQTVWLHRAGGGFDLYVHHADGASPDQTRGSYFLLRLDAAIDPVLSLSRPQESWDRSIYWLEGEALHYVRLQGQGARGEPGRFGVSYPNAELLGRGATDPKGDLHVPLWVPAPSGGAGQVQVASIRESGRSRLRPVCRLERRPALVEAAVDGAGDLRLLVGGDLGLDLYQVARDSDLPADGRRLMEGTPALARFDYLPRTPTAPGGLSVLALFDSASPAGGPTLETTWYNLGGGALKTFPAATLPAGYRPEDVLARGYDPPVILLKQSGVARYLTLLPGGAPSALELPAGARLARDTAGGVWLRVLSDQGGPVAARKLPL